MVWMIVTDTKSEYERLNGHLPIELERMIKEFSQPVYQKTFHYNVVSPLLAGMKMVIVRKILYEHFPEYRGCTFEKAMENQHYRDTRRKLLKKQTGQLFEEHMSRNLLRDMLSLIRYERLHHSVSNV